MFERDGIKFFEFAAIIVENKNLSLRQIEKIFSHARLSLNLFPKENYLFPALFFWLIYMRESDINFYNKIKNTQLTPQNLIDEVETKFNPFQNELNLKKIIYLESILLYTYNNNYQEIIKNGNTLTEIDDVTGENKLSLVSKMGGKVGNKYIIDNVRAFNNENISSLKLTHLLDKIELMEKLIS